MRFDLSQLLQKYYNNLVESHLNQIKIQIKLKVLLGNLECSWVISKFYLVGLRLWSLIHVIYPTTFYLNDSSKYMCIKILKKSDLIPFIGGRVDESNSIFFTFWEEKYCSKYWKNGKRRRSETFQESRVAAMYPKRDLCLKMIHLLSTSSIREQSVGRPTASKVQIPEGGKWASKTTWPNRLMGEAYKQML